MEQEEKVNNLIEPNINALNVSKTTFRLLVWVRKVEIGKNFHPVMNVLCITFIDLTTLNPRKHLHILKELSRMQLLIKLKSSMGRLKTEEKKCFFRDD